MPTVADRYAAMSEDVRQRYALDVDASPFTGLDYKAALAEFDRWLAEHDREVSAKALEDAAEQMDYGIAYTGPAREWLTARAAEIREGKR